ncbi:MAG: hypothetical protein GBAus27B_000291 [Mycoplasmataceae bacterium]|nr:MAG: hypothetical protein GBAus27B_000291 [Mycoplasmataceae bacterium]
MATKKTFKEVLAEIESPQDIGQGFWDLPENPTPSQLVKYELCEKILGYQEDNSLSDKEISKRINLPLIKTEDILFCRIEKVNSDELINAVSSLFSPAEIKIIVEQKKSSSHVWVV